LSLIPRRIILSGKISFIFNFKTYGNLVKKKTFFDLQKVLFYRNSFSQMLNYFSTSKFTNLNLPSRYTCYNVYLLNENGINRSELKNPIFLDVWVSPQWLTYFIEERKMDFSLNVRQFIINLSNEYL
jgi:hypothetical protein